MDIGRILKDWPLGEGSNVRRIIGDDGREKIQIRVCIDSFNGLLQFECDGRPDGQRLHGKAFYLDYAEEKCRLHQAGSGEAKEFRLTHSQCEKLFEESGMVYHRYVILLQLGDFERVIRDTDRNMRLFQFVNRYAVRQADREHLECWWPYILRIHFTAKAMEHLRESRIEKALEAVADCRARLGQLADQDNETFKYEMQRSREALEELEGELRKRKPLSEIEKLQRDLRRAVDDERYEDAARLRDKIARFESHKSGEPGG
ncbi:MAG: UvrB/UvrC motif-containing protein [Planctomycetota bacterium]|nr:UvrB/UvrC motif-containing protein [Planctomycetota bacterium]